MFLVLFLHFLEERKDVAQVKDPQFGRYSVIDQVRGRMFHTKLYFQTLRSDAEFFLTKFEVFGNQMKCSFKCLITWRNSKPKFIKFCFLFLNYYSV